MHAREDLHGRGSRHVPSLVGKIEGLLADRSSRADLETRGIYRRLGVHVAGCYDSGAWNWTRGSSKFASALDTGIGFCVATSTDGYLIAVGTPQSVAYEALSAHNQSKKRSKQSASNLCHPPKASDRKLSQDEAVVMATKTSAGFPLATRLVSSLHHSVRQFACGVSHCIALVQGEGGGLQLRSWGLGQYGQLGLGQLTLVATTMTPITTSVELLGALAANSNRSDAFRLSCGPLSSCLTLTNAVSTSVWLWGLLPSPHDAQSFVHQHVPSADFVVECPFRVKQVSLGLAHLILLSESGRVFTWGHNSCGQLGLGLQHTQNAVGNCPLEVRFHDSDLVFGSISCGYDHNLALSQHKSQLFVWGSNRLGACGATTKFFEYSHPVLLGFLRSNERIQSISCKAHTSVAEVTGPTTRRTVVWGVCGTDTARLLPSTVYETGCVDGILIGVIAGFGVVHSLVGDDDERLRLCGESTVEEQPQSHIDTEMVAHESPRIIGTSVIPASDETPARLCDLHWTRPVLHRLRVITGDIVVVLIQVQTPLKETSLVVQSSLESPYPVDFSLLHSKPEVSLYLLALPVESVQRFDLEWHGEQSSDPTTLLSVDCCLHQPARDEVLNTHHHFLLSSLTKALEMNGQEPFAAFIASICRNHEVDDAIAYSPLAMTVEQDQLESTTLDIDRSAMEKAHRLSCLREGNSQLPSSFGLWKWYLEPSEDTSELQDQRLEGVSLSDLLTTMQNEACDDATHLEMLYLSIANHIVECRAPPSPDGESDQIEAQEPAVFYTVASVVSLSSPVKLSVPQSAIDFLVSGSKSFSALHHDKTAVHQQAGEKLSGSGIQMWQNDRGDLLYSHITDSSGDAGVVQIHLPDDHHDSSRSTAPRIFQCELHRFLWEVIDTHSLSIGKLYSRLGVISDSEQLQTRLGRLGFTKSAPREVWFSVFSKLQAYMPNTSDTKSQRLTLHALRLFLVDPFHDEFFRNYVADWRDAVQKQHQVKGKRFRVRDLLARAFAFDAQEIQRVSWGAFVSGLYRLHGELRWDLLEGDACRLLYHFDFQGDGFVDLGSFLKCLVGQYSESNKPQRKRTTAIDPSRRRPELDTFATPDAMRKLFKSRAGEDDGSSSNHTKSEVSKLLRVGNTRLAQIRNLPVSRLLSEGVHFRPRKTKYQSTSSSNFGDEES